jgi:hypothetical protein
MKMNIEQVKKLDQAATSLLRKNGYTWAGNKQSQELNFQRMFEKSMMISNGKSIRKPGIINIKG